MTDSDPDDDLANAIRELTRTIEELRTELEEPSRRGPRFPAPRPPTPRELLRVADEVAIPALVATLESSVRTLEALQRGLEIVRTEREVRDRVDESTGRAGTRANDVRRATLSQLDTVLAELQRAAADGSLPADEDARELLVEARELRDEVDGRLRRAVEGRDESDEDGPIRIDIDQPDGTTETDEDGDESDSSVDVDAELETLKDRYSEDERADEATDENERAEDDESGDDDPQTGSNR
ncbi:hypothetical protein [Natronococcus sp.]|uniref:DUF7547 family protein n=1 Tax=Natronococcus sp. TaxID=35747 RepID=UPI0025CD0934|nr:hypothetical protein [Natronococcus sp.]